MEFIVIFAILATLSLYGAITNFKSNIEYSKHYFLLFMFFFICAWIGYIVRIYYKIINI